MDIEGKTETQDCTGADPNTYKSSALLPELHGSPPIKIEQKALLTLWNITCTHTCLTELIAHVYDKLRTLAHSHLAA